MKAIVHTKYGSPDVLRLTDVEKPSPRADEVLVKVAAAAVNQADNHLLSGTMRFSTGLLKPKHQILGSDIAGRVEAVGTNVKQFQVGDAVFGDLSGHRRGGFAEYVTAPESALALKPVNISFADAAAVPMTAVTALQGLRDKGHIRPEQQVLINGASGGVGTFAVQIAKALGSEVTAVVSTRKMDMVCSIGADYIIDYTKEDFTQTGEQYDLIFDTVGNRSVAEYKRALQPQGRFVTTAFLPSLVIQGPWLSLTEGKKMHNMMAKPNQKDLDVMRDLLETNQVTPIIDSCYPLSDVPEALRYLGEGHAKGKAIITMSASSAGE
ncbi:MAG: NAD(P)-dependent alcohol dehydrogenase [Anaerolineaceae bacterium]|nr:NAD(P)-dependent alcohol dehydrogenase [Anaerolineaceae bacterium]